MPTVAPELVKLPNASTTWTTTLGAIGALAWALVGCPENTRLAGGAGVTATGGCWLMATPLIVAEMTLFSALVEVNVLVACPLPFVRPVAVNELPLPVEESTTEAPVIGLFE